MGEHLLDSRGHPAADPVIADGHDDSIADLSRDKRGQILIAADDLVSENFRARWLHTVEQSNDAATIFLFENIYNDSRVAGATHNYYSR